MRPCGPLLLAAALLAGSLRAAAEDPDPKPNEAAKLRPDQAWSRVEFRSFAAARRGPFEAREGFLLAQRRLTLPALSPDPLARGETRVRLDLDWGNDFARRLGRYFIDGEHRSLALTLRRGVTRALTLGARLPLVWRGGGFLDRFADWIHKVGFPDNGRTFFPRDRLWVGAVAESGEAIVWGGGPGAGLGKLELEVKLAPLRADTSRASLALVGRTALPTGTGYFRGGGIEGGGQLVSAVALGERWDAYAGAGLTFAGERAAEGFEYPRSRPFGHLGLEWRFARRWSALAQIDGGGRLLTNVQDYPGMQSYLRLGLKWDVGERTRLEGAFTENLKNQQATTDFAVYMAVARRF